ncbi:MAG: hypothetical protein IPO93_13125 [Actinobacteria bacterium]|nr:hypothetical protein [Actinomycetota bacterium]
MTSHRVRNATVLGALIIVALGALAWFLVLSPRLSKAADINAHAETVAAANLQLQNRYNQTIKQAASTTQAAADAQALFSTMPEEADLPTVLTQIAAAATDAGIKPNDISVISTTVPRTAEDSGRTSKNSGKAATNVNLAQMDISLTVNGDRKDLLRFLDNLQSLDRAILITSTELTSAILIGTDGEKFDTEMIKVGGSMFVLKSKLPDLVANVKQLLQEAQANGDVQG